MGGRSWCGSAPGADPVDVLPEGWNARTAAHEYGGGSWWVRDGRVWFANWADQRLYRLDPGGVPTAVTAEPAVKKGDRWADGDVSPDGRWLLCVRERHVAGGGPADAVNEIVRLQADEGAGGSAGALVEPDDVEVVVTGPGLRVQSPLEPRRRDHLLAGVGPPEHAVGRHPPDGP